jgi:endonuclease III related protein
MSTEERLQKIFNILLHAFGKRHWWPGETPLEIMVGAVLTQNTSWKNVEKAIGNMKIKGVMDMNTLNEIDTGDLADVIRSAGFFNIKSMRLKNLIKVICEEFNGSIENLTTIDTGELRHLLLGINGMGPETVDSILLYALNRPIFVVDAYTKRFLRNHGLYADTEDYHHIQNYFQENLPSDLYLFNEYHALIVVLCQTYCRRIPLCEDCPLRKDLDRDLAGLRFGLTPS